MIEEPKIQMIPIENIRVINPRDRGKKKFGQIVSNIADIGLKKPITVCPRADGKYDLICGQGRLEAFQQLGQSMVPAIVRNVSQENMLLMSLVENIARRNPTNIETVRNLVELRDRGYSHSVIGEKTGIAANHVTELIYLYDHGEERLITAVEGGKIPISAAIIIARCNTTEIQTALLESLENKQLSYKEIQRARVLVEMRRAFGKALQPGKYRSSATITGETVVRTFRKEQERLHQAVKKAELCEKRLTFTINAFRLLLDDENFVNLLRAEGLDTLPQYFAEHIVRSNDVS